MKRSVTIRRILATIVLSSSVAAGLLVGCSGDAPSATTGSPTAVVSILGADPPPGYARVTGVEPITFPPDHGPHPAQQIEWWYTTANLDSSAGQRFGIEVTFFRFGLDRSASGPNGDAAPRASAWATHDLHMAHFAITDVAGGEFHAYERFTRGAAGLAGAEGDPWRVWNESWSLTGTDGGPRPFPLLLRADDHAADGSPVAIDLAMASAHGPVLQGDRGFSRKGPEEGAASFYYSYPSLELTGTISLGGEAHAVTGTGWFDHEWSTSVLGETLDGWDWFALQFEDGARLMVYELRRVGGESAPHAAGTWITPDGTVRSLDANAIVLEVLDRWRSPASGVEYPSRWRIAVASIDLDCTVEPVLADQELRLSTRYWEGAVDVHGARVGVPVGGRGYVELVGYGEGAED